MKRMLLAINLFLTFSLTSGCATTIHPTAPSKNPIMRNLQMKIYLSEEDGVLKIKAKTFRQDSTRQVIVTLFKNETPVKKISLDEQHSVATSKPFYASIGSKGCIISLLPDMSFFSHREKYTMRLDFFMRNGQIFSYSYSVDIHPTDRNLLFGNLKTI